MTAGMIKSLTQKWKRGREGGGGVDPSSFDDPVATQTDWYPAAPGGASFGTHRLVRVSANRVEFSATFSAKFFFLIFFFAGLGVLGFQLNQVRIGQAYLLSEDTLVPILVGSVFAVVGGCLYWYGTTPRVFDQSRGSFWRGRKEPAMLGAGVRSENSTPLSSIHALQLLTEYVSGNKSSYYSYELNLVLGDGSRVNVVDHGNLERLRRDAQTLSQFLGKPIWDAIGSPPVSGLQALRSPSRRQLTK
jgi:hypothetical protein